MSRATVARHHHRAHLFRQFGIPHNSRPYRQSITGVRHDFNLLWAKGTAGWLSDFRCKKGGRVTNANLPSTHDDRCILQHRQTSRFLSGNIYWRCTNSTENMKLGDLHVYRHRRTLSKVGTAQRAHPFATPSVPA